MKAIVTVPTYGVDIERLNSEMVRNGFQVDWRAELANSNDTQLIKALTKGYQYVVAGGELWNREAIEANVGTLKMITRIGAGYDKVDLASASEFGIAVANTPGVNAPTIAEHAIALMLAVLRGIPKYDQLIREGQWTTQLINQLFGKKVGFVGFGAIAKKVALMLKGFNTPMVAYDVMMNKQQAADLGVTPVSLETLLAESDVVTLHVPLTEDTQRMVNRSFLSQMKSSAILINTSRGKVVHEQELIEALSEGTIAGAGLDVFENQPLHMESPLCKMSNVVMSSHIGGMTTESFEGMVSGCFRNVLDFQAGKPVVHILNPDYLTKKNSHF